MLLLPIWDRHHILHLCCCKQRHWRLLLCNTCHKIVKKFWWLRLSVCSMFVHNEWRWNRENSKNFYLELSEGEMSGKGKKLMCAKREGKKQHFVKLHKWPLLLMMLSTTMDKGCFTTTNWQWPQILAVNQSQLTLQTFYDQCKSFVKACKTTFVHDCNVGWRRR